MPLVIGPQIVAIKFQVAMLRQAFHWKSRWQNNALQPYNQPKFPSNNHTVRTTCVRQTKRSRKSRTQWLPINCGKINTYIIPPLTNVRQPLSVVTTNGTNYVTNPLKPTFSQWQNKKRRYNPWSKVITRKLTKMIGPLLLKKTMMGEHRGKQFHLTKLLVGNLWKPQLTNQRVPY